MKNPAVYIMANQRNGTIYTGVTSNIIQRIWQHKEGIGSRFTAQYQCKLLVYYELHATMENAISREKQIKGGSRAKKRVLIEQLNPDWKDLYEKLI